MLEYIYEMAVYYPYLIFPMAGTKFYPLLLPPPLIIIFLIIFIRMISFVPLISILSINIIY